MQMHDAILGGKHSSSVFGTTPTKDHTANTAIAAAALASTSSTTAVITPSIHTGTPLFALPEAHSTKLYSATGLMQPHSGPLGRPPVGEDNYGQMMVDAGLMMVKPCLIDGGQNRMVVKP
jgi:hypothetical protein